MTISSLIAVVRTKGLFTDYVYRVCQLDMLHFDVPDDQLRLTSQALKKKKVAAHSRCLDTCVLSIEIKKSNIGKPR